LRAIQRRHADFWQVTGDALDYALETLKIDRPDLRDRLMDLYLKLEAFPEVPDVLRRLKAAGFKTAILSNGSPMMLDAAVRNAAIHELLDAVLSVEEVGVYKPDSAVYRYAVDRLGIPSIQQGMEIVIPAHEACRRTSLCQSGSRRSQAGRTRLQHRSGPGWQDLYRAAQCTVPLQARRQRTAFWCGHPVRRRARLA
jgi:HAD superfamily hydrolase (TIGR01493 family)